MEKMQCKQCGGILDDVSTGDLRCRYCDTLYRIVNEISDVTEKSSNAPDRKKYYYLPIGYLNANCAYHLRVGNKENFCFARGGHANWGWRGLGESMPTSDFVCNTNKVFIQADEVIIRDYCPTFADYVRPETTLEKKVERFIQACHEWHEKRNKKMSPLIVKGQDDTKSYQNYSRWHRPPTLSIDRSEYPNKKHAPSSVPSVYLDGLIVEEVDQWAPRVFRDVFWGYTITVTDYYGDKNTDFYVSYNDGDWSRGHYSPLEKITPNLLVDHFQKRDYSATKQALDNYLKHCEAEVIRYHRESEERTRAVQYSINSLWTNSKK